VDAVVVARPPTSDLTVRPSVGERAARRAEQRDAAIETVGIYNPDAVVLVGVPFGHTRPQWILPYGGLLTVDGVERRLWADYS
jgi:muramoyltetrapeptide carboxypeptidase LdcA involved in peptidoglycan recycling